MKCTRTGDPLAVAGVRQEPASCREQTKGEGGPGRVGEHGRQVNGKTPKVNIGLYREISNKYLESLQQQSPCPPCLSRSLIDLIAN